jgi:lysozyme
MANIRADWCTGIIDLSDNQKQQSIDWAALKASDIFAVIHKATEADYHTDPFYHHRKQGAVAAGLLWGSYHYGRAAPDGATQAAYYLNVVNPGPDEFIALDCEKDCTLQVMEDFIKHLKAATNRFPVIYGRHRPRAILTGNKDSIAYQCPLWFIDYPPDPHITPTQEIPKGWADWTLWQYSDGKSGPSPWGTALIHEDVDRNVFKGDAAALTKAWPLTFAPAAAPGV